MMIAFVVVATLLALLAGVLLAAFDLPQVETSRLIHRLSLLWVIATSVTAAGGVAYALFV